MVVPYAWAPQLIHERCPCDPGSVDWLDRQTINDRSRLAEGMSDLTVGLAVAVPPVLDAFDLGLEDPFLEDLLVYGEVLAVNGALVSAAKYIVQRPLPVTYGGALLDEPGGYRSFYSGHTSLTVAALTAGAVTYGRRHERHRWIPWALDGVVGASVAVERVAAGRHFVSDVVVGAGAGFAVGYLGTRMHLKHQSWAVYPAEDGPRLAWVGRF